MEFSGSLSKPPYVFTYNDAVLLPPRDSKQQDLWGYYNGNLNPGTTLVPYYLFNDVFNSDSYFLDGADRRVDSTDAKACSLIQIEYPTGGTTTFNYHVNQAGDNRLIQTVPQFNSAAFNFSQNDPAFGNDSTSGSAPITINRSPANQKIDFNFAMGGWCPGVPQVANMTFSIISLNGTTTYATEEFGFSDVGTTKTATQVAIPNGSYLLTRQITAPPSISNVCDEAFGFQLTWTTSLTDSTQLAGGLRIASTVDYDGINHSNDVTRQYSYVNSSGASSGTTGEVISFGYPYSDCTIIESGSPEVPNEEIINDYIMRTATTNIPLAYTQGSSVGYSRVEVATTGPSNIGKEVDYFTSYADNPVDNNSFNFPFVPTESQDWALGKLLLQEIYDGNGNLLKKTVNQYVPFQNNLDTLVDFKMAMTFNGSCQVVGMLGGSTNAPPILSQYTLQTYFWFLGYLEKSGTTTVDYSNTGDSVVNQVFYQYDPVYFEDVTQETRVDSKGDTVIDYHYYPFDYTLSGSPLGDMVDSNMIAETVSNETWKKFNGSYMLTSADATNYNRFTAGIFPANYYLFGSSQPVSQSTIGSFNPNQLLRVPSLYYQDLSFDAYDPKGNAIQINQKGKITNYIWDINKQYPIAKIANADTSSIAYTSFEADGSGNWVIGSGTVDATMAITGSSSYNLTGSISKSGLNSSNTYIVSYWTTNGSPFSISGTISGYPVQGKTEVINNNSWTLFVHKVSGQSTIAVNGSGHIDELRLYPATAQMTSYTYAPLVGMTSQADAGNRVTYYEYDGLQRLKRIRDQDYNILKTFDYQYQVPGGCGSGCVILTMETLGGSNTLGYPVGVFDIHGNLVGNASGASNYVSLWNSDTADARVGTLAAGGDSMHFTLTLHTGQTAPAGVTGCRYYQYDLPWNSLDGITCGNGAYVDFGDGIHMTIPTTFTDTPAIMPPNTTHVGFGFFNQVSQEWWFDHSYPDTSLKTITIYHNDDAKAPDLDDGLAPATSLTKVRNLRGNIPQQTTAIGGSCFQQASALSVAGITNWSSISSITGFWPHCGDKINPCENMSYAQDFMANNHGLTVINTTQLTLFQAGYRDTTFKLSRLKSNWNTYFTQLQDIEISDEHWNREDLSGLTHLTSFFLLAGNQNHSNSSFNNPNIPIPASVVDGILNQVAAGAGQFISNGIIGIATGGGTGRTSASDASVNALLAKGWTLYVDGFLTPVP